MFKVKVLTLFPDLFPGQLGVSVLGKALERNLWGITAADIRSYTTDKHRTVDDYCYGGGAGMILRCDVLGYAIENFFDIQNPIILMSPAGKKLNASLISEMISYSGINVICPRFEGVDARVIEYFQQCTRFIEVSIGDYVISSGDLAAHVLIDACVRMLPNVLGADESLCEESFSMQSAMAGVDTALQAKNRKIKQEDEYCNTMFESLLEYPQYTRPRVWRELSVPGVLLSGNHQAIKNWRTKEAKHKTSKNRPDLLRQAHEKAEE